jgi:hypothetical protein
VREHVRLDPGAGVADGEAHVRAARQIDPRFVGLDVRRLDREHAAAAHRVPRVHGEIRDHLLELGGIGLHEADVRLGVADELDVLANQAAQHLNHAAQH